MSVLGELKMSARGLLPGRIELPTAHNLIIEQVSDASVRVSAAGMAMVIHASGVDKLSIRFIEADGGAKCPVKNTPVKTGVTVAKPSKPGSPATARRTRKRKPTTPPPVTPASE